MYLKRYFTRLLQQHLKLDWMTNTIKCTIHTTVRLSVCESCSCR